jgi:hypothetical protein
MNTESTTNCIDITEYVLKRHANHVHSVLAKSPDKHGFSHAVFGKIKYFLSIYLSHYVTLCHYLNLSNDLTN